MVDRNRLHELIDTLPEGSLPVAQGSLEHLQTWPPQPPARIRELREAHGERMRNSMRSGMMGGGGGGGSCQQGPGGRIEYGSHGYDLWEGDTSVTVTHRFFGGHELVVEGRLRFVEDRTKIVYRRSVTGPGGETETHESVFAAGPL